MRRQLNEWAKFGKAMNWFAILFFACAFLWLAVVGCEDTYIGKSKDEIEKDMSRLIIEVDSLLVNVKFQADTLGLR